MLTQLIRLLSVLYFLTGAFSSFGASPSSSCDISCRAERKDIRKFGGGRVLGVSVEDPYFPSF